MKIMKKILLGIVILIVLVLLIAAFTKKSYTIKREVVIMKPAIEVYDYVRFNKNQVDYNSWYKMDPATKIELRGTDGEVGSIWAWDSELTGKGEQQIKALSAGSKIDYEITFIKPFAGKAESTVLFEKKDSLQTRMVNTFSSSTPYPMNIMLLFMDMDKMIGTEIQNGLNNIKANMEN